MINLWIGGYCPTFSPFPFFGGFKHRSIGGQHPIYIRVILEIKKNMLGRAFGIIFFFPTSYPWTHCMLQQCLTARVHCEDLTSHAQLNPGWLERTVSCLVSVCAVFVVWKPLESFGIAALTGISLRHCVMNPKYQPKLAKHWLKLVRGFDRSIFFRFCIYHPWDLPCWDAYHRTPLVAYASRRPRSQVKCLPPGGSNYGGCSWGYGCKFKLGSTPYNLGYNPHN